MKRLNPDETSACLCLSAAKVDGLGILQEQVRRLQSVAGFVRMLGHVSALAFVVAGVLLPFAGYEFAVFYFLIAIFVAATGDFLAILITEGVADLRSKRGGYIGDLRLTMVRLLTIGRTWGVVGTRHAGCRRSLMHSRDF